MDRDDVVYRSISFTDLEEVGYSFSLEAINEGAEETDYRVVSVTKDGNAVGIPEFYRALYFLGIKNNEYVHVEPKTEHFTSDRRITKNHRITGEERNDKQWLASGYASEEAMLSSSKFKDMVYHGMKMQRGGI